MLGLDDSIAGLATARAWRSRAALLVVGTIDDRMVAALALVTFAAATDAVVPVLGVAGMLFGVWYALGSVDAVPYAF